MEVEEYRRTAAAEDRHFWFRESRLIWSRLLRREAKEEIDSPSLRLRESETPPGGGHGIRIALDAGCGTGGNLRALEGGASGAGRSSRPEELPAGSGVETRVFGLDLSPVALDLARARVRSPLVRGSVLALPFREGTFDLVLCADVLYHEAVPDDLRAMSEFHRVLRPGGFLCVNVPAFESLRSAHDRAMHTARRYTRAGLRERLIAAGFTPRRIIYWSGLLLPPAILLRLVRRGRGKRSEIVNLPRPLNAIAWGFARLDAALAMAGLFPAGLSIAALARKGRS